MGLTIHWEAADPKAYISEKTARACVNFVKEIAQRENWPILGLWEEEVNPSDYEPASERTRTRTIGISVHPHKDCEDVTIAFDLDAGKLGRYEDYGGQDNKYHYTSQFCKTHYAGFPTHRKVCRLLQAIDKHFVKLDVSDEGNYYGIWDNKKGKECFGEYVAFVHGFGKALSGQLGIDKSQIISSEDTTDGWKEEYVDHLAAKMKQDKK